MGKTLGPTALTREPSNTPSSYRFPGDALILSLPSPPAIKLLGAFCAGSFQGSLIRFRVLGFKGLGIRI